MHPTPFLVFCPALLLAGCATVKVEPIHITVDINIKVDKALDEFFGKPAPAPATPAPTTPAAPAPDAK